MSNISKIKVNNEIYDLKDSISRAQGYARVVCEWDGVTEGLQKKSLVPGIYDYYRVGDAVDVGDSYLIGVSSPIHAAFSNLDDSDHITMMVAINLIAPTFGNANLYIDGISYKGNYADVYAPLLKEAEETGFDFSVIADKGETFGLSYMGIMGAMGASGLPGLMPHYINTAENLVLSAELMEALYGIGEEVVFTPGLWLLKSDLGQMLGYTTYPAWVDMVYIPGEDATKLMNFNLKKLAVMGGAYSYDANAQEASGNFVSYRLTNQTGFQSNQTNPSTVSSFNKNQIVYAWANATDSSRLTGITVTGKETGETYEASEVINIHSNYYYCTFGMPEEDVDVYFTFV